MNTFANEIIHQSRQAKEASRLLSSLPTQTKNSSLAAIARGLCESLDDILQANTQDYDEAKSSGMNAAMLDRLLLTAERVKAIAKDVESVAMLPDPIGEVFDERILPNGLRIYRTRVPLGVIAAIYESRPNVSVDIASLCLKSGNAVILRGGKETLRTNKVLVSVMKKALSQTNVTASAIQLIENTDHALVTELLKMRDSIDLVIPRGGERLIRFVRDNSLIPVVAGGIGVCHTFVDESADIEKATQIVVNAKVQRPTVCNALDTVLVHKSISTTFLPRLAQELQKAGVEMRCDPESLAILCQEKGLSLRPAESNDWGQEFLSLILAIRTVESIDEAIKHIAEYGSGHTEAILTNNESHTKYFINKVDAAAVMVNASTRFTDGAQFGLGAEIGISTQKMHARGPLGLREITSYKWIVHGNWHVRP